MVAFLAPHSNVARHVINVALLTTLVATLVPASRLGAQRLSDRRLAGRVSGSLALLGSEPRGEFGRNTDNGFGLSGTLVWHIDPDGIFSWRTEGSFLTYNYSSRPVPLTGTGGLVSLRLRTSNNIASAVLGTAALHFSIVHPDDSSNRIGPAL